MNSRHMLAQRLGITKAIVFAMAGRVCSLIGGVVTVSLVVSRFSPDVQGYYYTFSSLLLLQSVLELGFGLVLVQFISHEWAHLRFGADGLIEGDEKYRTRLASLVRLGIAWYGALAGVFAVLVGIVGHLFLRRSLTASHIDISRPWWALVAVVALVITLLPLRCCLEGSNQMVRVQLADLVATVLASVAGWIGIVAGAGLYTLAVVMGARAVCYLALLSRPAMPFLRLAHSHSHPSTVSWKRDVAGQQWRIAISYLCGFVMFQAVVPIVFHFCGAVEAGKLGASLQIYRAVDAVASSWWVTLGPSMGILGVRGAYDELVGLVQKTRRRSLAAAITCAIAAMAAILILRWLGFPQANRLVEPLPLAALLAVAAAIQLSNVETTAIRFQKREPFMGLNVVTAILMLISNVVMASSVGTAGVCAGFLMLMGLVLIPITHWQYRQQIGRLKQRAEISPGFGA